MTPPDTNPKTQARRHWPAVIAMAVAVVFGVAVILYWIGEEVVTAPGQDEAPAASAPAPDDLREGDVDAPGAAPSGGADPRVENPGSANPAAPQ